MLHLLNELNTMQENALKSATTAPSLAQLNNSMKLIGVEPVDCLNFDRLKWKLVHSSEATWDESIADFAEQEYRKFPSDAKMKVDQHKVARCRDHACK